MSQSRSGQDDPLIQRKLSARRVKRAVKAAERREKSNILKEEGDDFFRHGNFQAALDRYQQAIDVHGLSAKPILLSNQAVAYLKLCMYSEAHDAADRALSADPRSVKARYRRGMARKHLEKWFAAEIDFSTLLALDPGNKDAEAELAFVRGKRCEPEHREDEDEDTNSYSDYAAPTLEDDPQPEESLSESSDCEHTGNGIPCKFYNRTECKNGRACRYSHAPDEKSERDGLGRNVCLYYLIEACKFGERCSYLHSKEYLLQEGWWSTPEGTDRKKKLYNMLQTSNRAVAEANSKGSGTGPPKKSLKGKKRHDPYSRSGPRNGSRSGTGPSPRSDAPKGSKKPDYSYPRRGGYDSDGYDERGTFGFTKSDMDELICQGVKPWDDDAWDVLHALRSHY